VIQGVLDVSPAWRGGEVASDDGVAMLLEYLQGFPFFSAS